jgi:hypothetical protein
MDRIVFNEAAFRHGQTERDIIAALQTRILEEPVKDEINKYLVIGFNSKSNPIEVMYNEIDDDHINIFHAMPCRKKYLDLLN